MNRMICREMTKTTINAKIEEEVSVFLATGESDPLALSFPGRHTRERLRGYERHLREALIDEVRRRERGRRPNHLPPDFDPVAWTKSRVEPMIAGLFRAAERPAVLDLANRSVVFLTRQAAHRSLGEAGFLDKAWMIANIYLHSIGVPTLDGDRSLVVGMSVEKKCYVSLEYFAEKDPFADYVVHEVAHLFHNCKRRTIGLPHSRSRQWLLDIAFAKREPFAYACEFYSRILNQTKSPAQRSGMLAEFADHPKLTDERVEHEEVLDLVKEAVAARNGWKRILAACSNDRSSRGHRV